MKIAILGLGKIGSGVYEQAARGCGIEVARVLDKRAWMDGMTTDIRDITQDEAIELVVETMGGLHPAFMYAQACLRAGKSYVTANKLLMSECGLELQRLADEMGVGLRFSASCGGGIPYLDALCKAAQTDEITRVGGILNGTTNYMLDRMQHEGLSYEEALSEAQALGYAELDPLSDVDGLDAARKLALACAVGFGKLPRAGDIPTRGIRGIAKEDIAYFADKELTIRLCAEASRAGDKVCACVQPVLYTARWHESTIMKNVNYIWYDTNTGGRFAFSGQGAGKQPTALNVLADCLQIEAGQKRLFPNTLDRAQVCADDARAYYIRLKAEGATEATQRLWTDARRVNGWLLGVTIPLAAADIHDMMSKWNGEFFAAIA